MNEEEIEELKRLCEKVMLSFSDIEQIKNLMLLNTRFDYHESTNRFDLDIYLRKRKHTIDEMLQRETPSNYGTMELLDTDKVVAGIKEITNE